MNIRPAALYAIYEIIWNRTRDHRSNRLDPREIMPYFMIGHALNEALVKLGRDITVTMQGRTEYRLKNFRLADKAHEPIRDGKLVLECDGIYFKGAIYDTDFHVELPGGEWLYVRLPKAPKEPEPAAEEGERRDSRRAEFSGCIELRKESFPERDWWQLAGFLQSATLTALTAVFPQEDIRGPKDVPDVAYDLRREGAIAAAARVINRNITGDRGEDIMVRYLLTNQTEKAFSYDFADFDEWYNARSRRGHSAMPRMDFDQLTPDEQRLADAFMQYLKTQEPGKAE